MELIQTFYGPEEINFNKNNIILECIRIIIFIS